MSEAPGSQVDRLEVAETAHEFRQQAKGPQPPVLHRMVRFPFKPSHSNEPTLGAQLQPNRGAASPHVDELGFLKDCEGYTGKQPFCEGL